MGEDVDARTKLAEEARGFKIFLVCLVLLAAVVLVIWVVTSTPSRSSSGGHPSSVSISVPLTDADTAD